MYADGVVLLANDPAALQLQPDALARFCTDWDMDVNLAKTRVVVFNSGRGWRPGSQPAPAHLALPATRLGGSRCGWCGVARVR